MLKSFWKHQVYHTWRFVYFIVKWVLVTKDQWLFWNLGELKLISNSGEVDDGMVPFKCDTTILLICLGGVLSFQNHELLSW